MAARSRAHRWVRLGVADRRERCRVHRGGVVHIGAFDDSLHAYDAGTGAELWRYTTGNDIDGPPTVVDGTVYVGSNDARLYAFDLAGGLTP